MDSPSELSVLTLSHAICFKINSFVLSRVSSPVKQCHIGV